MYEQFLEKTGLSKEQAAVYEVLVKQGPLPAGKLSSFAGLKRGLTYKVLGELEGLGLVEKKDEPKKVLRFEATHPLRMRDLVEKNERNAKDAREVLETVLPKLVSDFNLVSGKPGVQFYEGKEGVKEVLADSLTSKTEIYSYADIEAIVKYIKDTNEWYVAKRERLEIKKKGILLDTPFSRQYLTDYHKVVTDTKFIKYDAPPFQSVMQIYDNKISYITLAPEHMIGVIITDQHIYEMHKYLFEYAWWHAD